MNCAELGGCRDCPYHRAKWTDSIYCRYGKYEKRARRIRLEDIPMMPDWCPRIPKNHPWEQKED